MKLPDGPWLRPGKLRVCTNPACPEHFVWRRVCRTCRNPTRPQLEKQGE